MGIKTYGDYRSVITDILKDLAIEEIKGDDGFKISNIFDTNYKRTDKYKSVVLKSTFKDPNYFTFQGSDIINFKQKETEQFVKKRGIFGLSKDELKNRLSDRVYPELRNYLSRVSDVSYTINGEPDFYWNNTYQYKHENPDTDNSDEKNPRDKTSKEWFFNQYIFITNYEYNPHGNNRHNLEALEGETGYIVPEYKILKMQEDFLDIETNYSKLIDIFDLKKSVDLSKVTQIGDYRDILEKQLTRQLDELIEYNKTIKKLLERVYHDLEENMFSKGGSNEHVNDEKELIDDWFHSLVMLKAIYDSFYLNFTDDWRHEFHINEVKRNPYLNASQKRDAIDILEACYQKKTPIISIARKIALKARITEAIIEGFIIDDSLKSLNEVIDNIYHRDLPRPKPIAEKFYNRKKNKFRKYKVKDIEPVMEFTRDHIRNNIREQKPVDMNGQVGPLAEEYKEEYESKISKKTLSRYIKYYSIAAGYYKESSKK